MEFQKVIGKRRKGTSKTYDVTPLVTCFDHMFPANRSNNWVCQENRDSPIRTQPTHIPTNQGEEERDSLDTLETIRTKSLISFKGTAKGAK